MESWAEDELATVLHEASHDLGVSQKTFMTVLRHALTGMKVCGIKSRNPSQIVIVLADWAGGSRNPGCSWKRAERGPSAGSRDRILTMMRLNLWFRIGRAAVDEGRDVLCGGWVRPQHG